MTKRTNVNDSMYRDFLWRFFRKRNGCKFDINKKNILEIMYAKNNLREECKKRIEADSLFLNEKQFNEAKPCNKSISSSVRIYNVGKANFVIIENVDVEGKTRTILFDCGLDEDGFTEQLSSITTLQYKENLLKLLCELKPDILVISHWHFDHYSILGDIVNGDDKGAEWDKFERTISKKGKQKKSWSSAEIAEVAKNLKNSMKSDELKFEGLERLKYVIIPCYPNKIDLFPDSNSPDGLIFIKDYIYFFLLKLNKDVKILNSDLINENEIYQKVLRNEGFDNIKIFKSIYDKKVTGLDPDVNNYGILIQIEGKDDNIVLPGDCWYRSWPKEIDLEKTSHLMMPHHGGNAGVLENEGNGYQSNNKYLYISGNIEKCKQFIYEKKLIKNLKSYGFEVAPKSTPHVLFTHDLQPTNPSASENYYKIRISLKP